MVSLRQIVCYVIIGLSRQHRALWFYWYGMKILSCLGALCSLDTFLPFVDLFNKIWAFNVITCLLFTCSTFF